jgi:hypothetical protein
MKCKHCDQMADRRPTAARALKLMASLPDQFTCTKNFPKSTAEFLSAARDFAAECAMAHTWTEEETRIRYDALKLSEAGSNYFRALEINNGGGSGLSPSQNCEKEMRDCIKRCDDDPDAGYTCYFDCRLAFYACLAGSIFGRSGGGAVIA